MTTDFRPVTETPGDRVTARALEMVWTRYRFAADFCPGRDVLEVGCGAGQGLEFLGRHARRIVGGDYTAALLEAARQHGAAVPLLRLNAQSLPFMEASFDLVILYEAVYYLPEPDRFFAEARRVLRPGGAIIVGTVNPEVPDFNPSPYSHRYLTGPELAAGLMQCGFDVEVLGAFADDTSSLAARLVSLIKRVAVRFDLIPKTMKGKEMLKRLFLGRLMTFPAAIDEGMATYHEPRPIDGRRAPCRVLYAVGRLPSAALHREPLSRSESSWPTARRSSIPESTTDATRPSSITRSSTRWRRVT